MSIRASRSRSSAIRSVGLITLIFLLATGLRFFNGDDVKAQEKSVVWERFDVDINVNVDSSFDVAEGQAIRFTQGTFSFGTRYIPIRNFEYIDNWSLVDGEGNVYTQAFGGDEPYTFTVDQSSSRYDIRWYFPPVANSTSVYYLSYTVHGGLRFYEGGDQLWWKAIYGDRSFPVLEGNVKVTVPPTALIEEYAAYINGGDARDSASALVADDQRSVTFELTQTLQAGQDFEVRVQFTDGVVDGVAAPWQQSADAYAAELEAEQAFRDFWGPIVTLFFGAIGLLLMIGGPAALYALWYRFGRDKPVDMVADYLPEPPDTLQPGLAGTLLDEQADMQDVLATLVDLARRKAISITEDKQEGFLRFGTEFIYRRERDDVPMAPYEERLISAIFGSEREVKLSDLKDKFYTHLPKIKNMMYENVVDDGLFPRDPSQTRGIYQTLGVMGLFGSVAVSMALGFAFGELTGAAVLPGVGLGVTAIGLIVLARHMPRKTDKGAEVAARWQAFKTYLKDIDKYADMEGQKAIWDRWLPYAIAFGIDKQYISKFEAVNAPAPGWYFPTPGMYGPHKPWYYGTPGSSGSGTGDLTGGGLGNLGGGEGGGLGGSLSDVSRGMGASLAGMSAGLGAMLSSAGGTMTSRPSSSSSSGGGWSSGGGGFSGGGGGRRRRRWGRRRVWIEGIDNCQRSIVNDVAACRSECDSDLIPTPNSERRRKNTA